MQIFIENVATHNSNSSERAKRRNVNAGEIDAPGFDRSRRQPLFAATYSETLPSFLGGKYLRQEKDSLYCQRQQSRSEFNLHWRCCGSLVRADILHFPSFFHSLVDFMLSRIGLRYAILHVGGSLLSRRLPRGAQQGCPSVAWFKHAKLLEIEFYFAIFLFLTIKFISKHFVSLEDIQVKKFRNLRTWSFRSY